MKSHLIAIVTATALASGMGAASAADSSAASKTPPAMQSMTMQSMTKDNLSLTRSQQRTAWKDISKEASSQSAPANFKAAVGATIPGDIALQSVPADVASQVSSLKPYDYALLHHQLLIVNPTDKKVVDVIRHRA
jgi:hypothetical protein